MPGIIMKPEDILKKKQYLCSKCGKKYRIDGMKYAESDGKCPKCGEQLTALENKRY